MNAKSVTAALLAAAVGLVHAAGDDLLPAAETAGGIVYIAGGIGTGERDAMRAVAKDYNLRLAFVAGARGAYLGGADVRIEDGGGRALLEVKAPGPWFYARLPKGRYRIVASTPAGAITRDVDLAQRDAELVLRWSNGEDR